MSHDERHKKAKGAVFKEESWGQSLKEMITGQQVAVR